MIDLWRSLQNPTREGRSSVAAASKWPITVSFLPIRTRRSFFHPVSGGGFVQLPLLITNRDLKMLAKEKNEIRFTVNGDVVTRHVSLGSSERTSSLKMASWMDRTQEAEALFDQAWLTARREPELRSSNIAKCRDGSRRVA